MSSSDSAIGEFEGGLSKKIKEVADMLCRISFGEGTSNAEDYSSEDAFDRLMTTMENGLVQRFLIFLNSAANEEQLKRVKGITEKTATAILQICEEFPFKTLDDLENIGLSKDEITGLMQQVAEQLFEHLGNSMKLRGR